MQCFEKRVQKNSMVSNRFFVSKKCDFHLINEAPEAKANG